MEHNTMDHKRLETSFFISLLLIVLVFVLVIFSPYLALLCIVAALGVVFQPLHDRILALTPRHRGFAALLSIICIVLIVVLPLILFGFRIFGEAKSLYDFVASGGSSAVLDQAETFFRDRVLEAFPSEWRSVATTPSLNAKEYAQNFLGWIVQNIGAVFSGFARVLFMLFVSFIALYYIFKDGGSFRRILVELIPLEDRYSEMILEKLAATANSVIKGSLSIAILQGILCAIGFLIFGIPNPAVWGLLAVIASLIPPFGTALILVPAIGYLFFTENLFGAVGLAIWGSVLVGLIDNFVKPHLLTRGAKIHPFFILLGVLGGIRLFGPAGFLLGPLVLSLFFTLLEIYPHLILREKKHSH